jgi:EmrB/QacA subfamily drug resistance transporter
MEPMAALRSGEGKRETVESNDVTTESSSHAMSRTAPDPRRWGILAVVIVAQLMIVLDASIVTIALPSAQHALHISTANRQWVITAYTLAFGGLLLLGGRIADFSGRKRMFVVGLLGFAAASALGGLAVDESMLFAARALQGAFAALMAPAALSILTITFQHDAKERAQAFGAYGAVSGAGGAIGVLLGGVLTEYASWRWCLLVNVPIAILASIGAVFVVHESRTEGSTRYDVPGAVLSTLGLVSLVYGFTKAEGDGWGATVTVVLLVVAAVLLAGFVLLETRTSHPLLPIRVVRDRNRGGAFLASLLTGAGLFAMFVFLSYYLQSVLHYTPLKAGLAFLPFAFGIIFAAGASTGLVPRIGPRVPMTVGLLVAAGGLAWLTQIGVHSDFWVHVAPQEILMSMGLGLAFPAFSSTALIRIHDRDAGVASALVNTTQQIGGSLGTALLNTLAATATASYLLSHGVAATQSRSRTRIRRRLCCRSGATRTGCGRQCRLDLCRTKRGVHWRTRIAQRKWESSTKGTAGPPGAVTRATSRHAPERSTPQPDVARSACSGRRPGRRALTRRGGREPPTTRRRSDTRHAHTARRPLTIS